MNSRLHCFDKRYNYIDHQTTTEERNGTSGPDAFSARRGGNGKQTRAVAHSDGNVTFFNASGPVFTYEEDDKESLRLAAAMFSDPILGLASSSEIGDAVGRHRSQVFQYRRQYQEGGRKLSR